MVSHRFDMAKEQVRFLQGSFLLEVRPLNKGMNFKQFLTEMPIASINMRGNWDSSAQRMYGFDKKDAGILGNPKGVEKIKRSWSNSKESFDMYFVREKNAYKHTDIGEVDANWVMQNLGLEIQPNAGAITMIYTNNIGTEKMPMTAWTIAHRLGHAIRRESEVDKFIREVEFDFIQLLQSLYNHYPKHDIGMSVSNPNFKALAMAIGTMRSARERSVRNFYEFVFEMMAQYLITGHIKFNLPPEFLVTKNTKAWGRPNPQGLRSTHNAEELEGWREHFDSLAEKYEGWFDNIFYRLRGKIFLM